MNRSQRILIAIGIAALAAMAAPYVLRSVVDGQATTDKTKVFEAGSKRANKELVLCLIKHPGALNLGVASNDLYTDPASGLAIKVDDLRDHQQVTAWLPRGKSLNAAQAAQLSGCM